MKGTGVESDNQIQRVPPPMAVRLSCLTIHQHAVQCPSRLSAMQYLVCLGYEGPDMSAQLHSSVVKDVDGQRVLLLLCHYRKINKPIIYSTQC